MRDKTWYEIKDQHCLKALNDFREIKSVPDWLEEYMDLYLSVTLKPERLPRITLINLGEDRFENTAKFSRLFDMVYGLFL